MIRAQVAQRIPTVENGLGREGLQFIKKLIQKQIKKLVEQLKAHS